MMRKLLVAFLLFAPVAAVAVPPPPVAPLPAVDPGRLAKAERLVRLLNVDAMTSAVTRSVQEQMRTTMAATADAADGGAARRADPYFDARMQRIADVIGHEIDVQMSDAIHRLSSVMGEVYATQFTDVELDGMLAFYGSPVGQSTLAKLPQMLNDPRMRAAQTEMSQAMAARMPEIMRKAKAAAETLPPPPAKPAKVS